MFRVVGSKVCCAFRKGNRVTTVPLQSRLGNGYQGVGMHFSSLGHLFRDTLFHVSFLWSFSLAHVVRQSNALLHALVQRARLSLSFFAWMESVSSDINAFVWADFQAAK